MVDMQEPNRIALKEWAIVVQALGRGQQLILLRKGGIVEESGEFQLVAKEFFLYPTWEHQQEAWLQSRYVADFQALSDKAEENQALAFAYYAVVTDVWPAPELSRLKQLQGEFVWNEKFLEKRYACKPELPISLLAVRTYRLPQALTLPYREHYAGCRSWVELDEDLPVKRAVPVLEDTEFGRRREALRQTIQ